MNQHRQDAEPSLWWVTLYAVLGGLVTGFTLRVAGDGRWTWVHVVAVVFGLALFCAVMASLAAVTGQREQYRREQVRQRTRRENELAALVRDTGTWNGPHPGQSLAVRWSPEDRMHWVSGWLGPDYGHTTVIGWPDADSLHVQLAELEESLDLVPADDSATRAVRDRIGLPPYVSTTAHTQIIERPWSGDTSLDI